MGIFTTVWGGPAEHEVDAGGSRAEKGFQWHCQHTWVQLFPNLKQGLDQSVTKLKWSFFSVGVLDAFVLPAVLLSRNYCFSAASFGQLFTLWDESVRMFDFKMVPKAA